MRSLKDVYPQYQDEVAFYAIGVDPTEDLSLLEQYRAAQGYPWPVATASADMLADYNIVQQATKVAIDGTGVIIFRAGYGTESPETWRRVFSQLVGN